MRKLLFFLPVLAIGACSQTPVIVPVRSMERPQDVDFICMRVDAKGWHGAPIERCALDRTTFGPSYTGADFQYRLHAVVTQVSRGELAVVDLGTSPVDTVGIGIVKVDPRLPGYTFLPVGAVPSDVAADPNGHAIYVASAHDRRVDVIPSEELRGPIDSTLEQGSSPGWPRLALDPLVDGAPTRLSVVRDDLAGNRLYVLLPEAVGGPKLAVFDIAPDDKTNRDNPISPRSLMPPRIADIPLSVSAATPIGLTPLACGATLEPLVDSFGKPKNKLVTDPRPWWATYDQCFGVKTDPGTKPPVPPTQSTPHLAGIVVAGGYLYASDDHAPFIHVFDVAHGHGVEVQQIAIGAPTSRLAVSEPVPDEVTQANAAAIEVCEFNHWIGDGKDHSADSESVKYLLGGRCRAHRYIYAVDLDDPRKGNGSIAVVDLPVTYKTQPALGIDGKPAEGGLFIVDESIDFAGAQLAQPMGCDSPAFEATRIPLGNFSIGGVNAVPARSVTFMHYDPPSAPANLYGLRCRSGGRTDPIDATAPPLTPADAQARITAEQTWGLDPGDSTLSIPKRLRGTFAFALLDNGSIVVIDVDDYNSLCRGPNLATDVLNGGYFKSRADLSTPGALGSGSSGEYIFRGVRRHHPRSASLYDVNNPPTVSNLTLSNGTNSFGATASTPDELTNPHFLPLVSLPAGSTGVDVTNATVLPSPDNPYSITTEAWTATYQGVLPGFTGTAGSIEGDVFIDAAGAFCRRGTDATDPSLTNHDVVQIIDDVCDSKSGSSCSADLERQCQEQFGYSTDVPLKITRDLIIGQAFENKVTIAKHYERRADGTIDLKDGVHPRMKECFPGLTRYVVRAGSSWVVTGSTSGYYHRIKPRVDGDVTSECVVDVNKPMIYAGRAQQLPHVDRKGTPPAMCERFVNTAWQFAIEQGYDAKGNLPTQRDMRFTFAARFNFSPLTLGIGTLPTSIRPVTAMQQGYDLLRWDEVSAIDAIDKGLTLFWVGDLGGTNHVFN